MFRHSWLFTLVLVGAFLGISSSVQGGWREVVSTNGGAVNQIAVDSSGDLYVITAAGLFRSEDKGENWRDLNQGLRSSGLSLAASCIFTAGATVYVGGQFGVYKSTNNGFPPWTPILDSNTILTGSRTLLGTPSVQLIAGAQVGTQNWIFLATSGHGLLRSEDGGLTWSQVSSGMQNARNAAFITSIAIDPTSIKLDSAKPSGLSMMRLYTSTWRGSLFRSDDGGDTFQQMSDSGIWANGQIYVFPSRPDKDKPNVLKPDVLYTIHDEFSFGRGTILRSEDADHNTWVPAGRPANSTGIPGNGERNGVSQLAISPQDPYTVYAATIYGLFKTTDGGNIWNANPEYSPPSATLALRNISAVQIDYPPIPVPLGTNPALRVYASSGFYGFARSLNPVTGWELLKNGLKAAAITDIVVCTPPGSPPVMYAGAQTVGYVRFTVAGLTITQPAMKSDTAGILAGHSLSSLAVDAHCGTLLASTSSGPTSYVWRSIDAGPWTSPDALRLGDDFTQVDTNVGASSITFNPADNSKVLAALQDYQGAILSSKDGGAHWTVPEPSLYIYPGNFVYPYDPTLCLKNQLLCPQTSNIVITRGNQYTGAPLTDAYIMWSNNGGDTWNLSKKLGTGNFGAVALDANATLYVSGDIDANHTPGIYIFQIKYDSARTAVLSVSQTDFWGVPQGLTDPQVRRLLYDPVHDYLYASTASGVFRYPDMPLNMRQNPPSTWKWVNISAGLLPYLSTDAMAFLPDYSRLLVGTNGGIWEYTEPTPARLQFTDATNQAVTGFTFSAAVGSKDSKTLNVKNVGGTATSSLNFQINDASNPSAFSLPNPSGCVQALSPGAACSVTLTFTPMSTSSVSATLVVKSDACGTQEQPCTGGDHTFSILLSGTGVGQPNLTVSASTLKFPDRTVPSTRMGEAPPPTTIAQSKMTFTIYNSGNATASIILPTMSNDGAIKFAPDSTTCSGLGTDAAPLVITASASCNVNVTYTPAWIAPAKTCTAQTDAAMATLSTATLTINAGGQSPGPPPPPTPTVTASGRSLRDSDGDGIPDLWELHGITDENGNFLDLPGMGADWCRKDVFVQVNWMKTQGHTHILKYQAAQKVIDAFKNAPVSNIDRPKGIALHIDCGPGCSLDKSAKGYKALDGMNPEIPHLDPITGDANLLSLGSEWKSVELLKATYLLPRARAAVFHYILMAHQQADIPTSSGLTQRSGSTDPSAESNPFGSDSVVTLGAFEGFEGDPIQQAGTLMHELGHSLGLDHGGYRDELHADLTNNKPNYFSVMNYLFQTRGVVTLVQKPDGSQVLEDGLIDFSRVDAPSLAPTSLSESNGVYGTTAGKSKFEPMFSAAVADATAPDPDDGGIRLSYGTRYFCQGFDVGPTLLYPIDWDCDPNWRVIPPQAGAGISDPCIPDRTCRQQPIAANIADNITMSLLESPLSDWAHLIYTGHSIGQLGAPPPPPAVSTIKELTVEQDAQIKTIHGVLVFGPNSVRLPLNSTTTLNFTVKNKGTVKDTFVLTASSSQPWVNLSAFPRRITLDPGVTSGQIQITATTPAALAPQQAVADVILTATSSSNANILDSSHRTVTAGSADLGVAVTGSPDPTLTVSNLTYLITVTNNGPDTARNVVLTNTFPAGVTVSSILPGSGSCMGPGPIYCSLGTLAAGAQITVKATVVPTVGGTLINSATVSSDVFDPTSANNSANASSTVVGRPSVAARVLNQSRSGNVLTLNIQFTNVGIGAAYNALVTRVDLRTLTGTGSVTLANASVPFSIGNLAQGGSIIVPLAFNVPSTVSRFSLTEVGFMQDSVGNQYSFSPAQAITP